MIASNVGVMADDKPTSGSRYMRLVLSLAVMLPLLLFGCARDLVLDTGDGDSIRMVGAADNFKCDDPAYAHIKKVVTAELVFADGSRQDLCKPEAPSR